MEWDHQVPGTFGGGYFAPHPADEKRAFEWLADLRRNEVGWKAARQQLKSFMQSKKYQKKHIQRELASARRFLKPWLTD